MLNHLFVYGTLRKSQNGKLHPYLKDRAVFIDRGCLPGKLYQIDNYPGAVPVLPDNQCRVYGEVYRLFHPKNVLLVLDEYEECTRHFPEPHEYRRVPESVTLSTGERVQAWVYWFSRPIVGLKQLSSGDYFDYPADTVTNPQLR